MIRCFSLFLSYKKVKVSELIFSQGERGIFLSQTDGYNVRKREAAVEKTASGVGEGEGRVKKENGKAKKPDKGPARGEKKERGQIRRPGQGSNKTTRPERCRFSG